MSSESNSWKLGSLTVNSLTEKPGPLEAVKVSGMQSRVVNAKRVVDGRAVGHELDRAPRVGGDVADGDEAVGQDGRPRRGLEPRGQHGLAELLGVGDGEQARGVWRPVDAVDEH